MEYAEHGSLFDYLIKTKNSLTWPKKISLLLDIARGMQYLHKSEVIHRDLKAENILV